MPESIDLGPLRGRRLPGTRCTFDRHIERGFSPGSGTIGLGVNCLRPGAATLNGAIDVSGVVVGEDPRSGNPPPDDSIRCRGDPESPPLGKCDLLHAKISIFTRATCYSKGCGSQREARKLMAELVKLLVTLPERPCRLCPPYLSPERVAELTRDFYGNGPKRLGTIELKVDSTIRYSAENGGLRVTSGRPRRVLLDNKHPQGAANIARGTYHDVKIRASGRWGVLIQPR